jgi:DNA (cytosine-5)-methyltransferase 1
MDESIEIKSKREALGLSVKEFADAIGLGKDDGKLFRSWESGNHIPTSEQLNKILSFAVNQPYAGEFGKESFNYIDLFAGIGGIRIPFQELGGKCVFTSEWDSFAQKTYKINFGGEIAGDITQVEAKDIPEFDVLLGGFPCQPFSQAGLRKGFSDTRGTLFFDIERIISAKRPKMFLLENVKQLKGHDKGRTFKVIEEHLRALNYSVTAQVLRAGDFGVPQNRERIYIVGFDRDYYGLPEDFCFDFPIPPKTKTRLGDILEPEVNSKYTISQKLYDGHLRRKEEHKQKGNGFGFSLFNAESEYTNTLSARYYKDGSEILIEQLGIPPRKLTPRECARLQGFPEEFIISVSDMRAYKQFGNSVAVPVIRAIAKNMVATMEQLEKKKNG